MTPVPAVEQGKVSDKKMNNDLNSSKEMNPLNIREIENENSKEAGNSYNNFDLDRFTFPSSICTGQKVPIRLHSKKRLVDKDLYGAQTMNSANKLERDLARQSLKPTELQGPRELLQTKENSPTSSKKRSLACASCRKSHLSCDGGRPCQRCIKKKITYSCVDPPKVTKKRKLQPLTHMSLLPAPKKPNTIFFPYTTTSSNPSFQCPIPNICNTLQADHDNLAALNVSIPHMINTQTSSLTVIPNSNGVFSVIPCTQNSYPQTSSKISQNIGQFWTENHHQNILDISSHTSHSNHVGSILNSKTDNHSMTSHISNTSTKNSSTASNASILSSTTAAVDKAQPRLEKVLSKIHTTSFVDPVLATPESSLIDEALSCFSYLFDASLIDLLKDPPINPPVSEGLTEGIDIEDMAQLFFAATSMPCYSSFSKDNSSEHVPSSSLEGTNKKNENSTLNSNKHLCPSNSKKCVSCPFNKLEKFFLKAAGEIDHELPLPARFKEMQRAKKEAGLVQPYNYARGYYRLEKYLEKNLDTTTRHEILEDLGVIKEGFAEMAKNMTEQDALDSEEQFDRFLLEYDRIFHGMGVPAVLWRRTGEIYRANSGFCELVHLSCHDVKEGKISIYELMENDALVLYWQKYCEIACSVDEKAVMTSCVLKSGLDIDLQDKLKSHPLFLSVFCKSIECSFSFTIRRDKFGIPLAIVGHFMPIQPPKLQNQDQSMKIHGIKDNDNLSVKLSINQLKELISQLS